MKIKDLPFDIWYFHIFPKCDLDIRIAFKLKPNKINLLNFTEINKCLEKQKLNLNNRTEQFITTESGFVFLSNNITDTKWFMFMFIIRNENDQRRAFQYFNGPVAISTKFDY